MEDVMKNKQDAEYFKAGEDWYADRVLAVKIQANRWFLGFLVSIALSITLTIALISLLPLKTPMPFVIHQNTLTGEAWVDRPQTKYTPINNAEVQSDIARYITARESYLAADINQRFNFVKLLSDGRVGKEYGDEQSNDNKLSPVNVLGEAGTRTTHIEDIIFIDKAGTHEIRDFHETSHNLAKVDFTTTTTDRNGNKKTESFVATVGWAYNGLPLKQEDVWENWSGFTVTTYRADPKNIG